MALLPVEDALARLLEGAVACPFETVPLHEAAGRVLAAPLDALRTQPPFDASAMDGYALRAADIVSVPTKLAVIGESAAGRGFGGMVGAGQAVRIFTGAPVPQGADTVVIQEDTEPTGEASVEIRKAEPLGRHIRTAGLDFREGQPVLEAGRLLDAAALSLAAACNHAALRVVGRPLVAILATGDELLPPGSATGPDQIIASNGFGVAAIASQCGARVLDLGIAPDRLDAIRAAIARAEDAGADIIVTLGGASVGDHDLVKPALESAGMTLGFWKIAMRPGKPLMVGRLGNRHVLGLPGNPVSSLVCAHLFLKPLIARLSGRAFRADIRMAKLETPMVANDIRQDYVRAACTRAADGLSVRPFAMQDSSMLSTLAASGGLIIRPPLAPAADAGETVPVLMLRELDVPSIIHGADIDSEKRLFLSDGSFEAKKSASSKYSA